MKHRWVAYGVAAAVLAALALAGCAPSVPLVNGTPVPTITTIPAEPVPTLTVKPGAVLEYPVPAPLQPTSAPVHSFPVGKRQLDLSRFDRPLRTVLWYPSIAGDPATVASGRFPLVVFSHGLRSAPESYERILATIAAAGFVVAAPAYPYTNADADPYNPTDLVNQPADASMVITALLALGDGDPLAGHLDPTRVGAAGHSGGAFTTMGLLAGARDNRVRAAVVIAGGTLGGEFTGPQVPVLFVHGDADQVVSYGIGRATYDLVPWPKAFLTVRHGDHSAYLYRTGLASATVASAIVDFLRAMLYGDATARDRLPATAVDQVTAFESTMTFSPPASATTNPASASATPSPSAQTTTDHPA